MSTVNEMITEIRENLSQNTSSSKDEIRVMKAMLNDTDFEVDVYSKDGSTTKYSPAKDFRSMCASIVSGSTKIPQQEAVDLVNKYEVKKAEAESMVNISKEFINTYIHTGRKLPLGPREKSDIYLSLKNVEETTRYFPKKTGVNDDGSDRYDRTATVVPSHESIKVHAPCPAWIKK